MVHQYSNIKQERIGRDIIVFPIWGFRFNCSYCTTNLHKELQIYISVQLHKTLKQLLWEEFSSHLVQGLLTLQVNVKNLPWCDILCGEIWVKLTTIHKMFFHTPIKTTVLTLDLQSVRIFKMHIKVRRDTFLYCMLLLKSSNIISSLIRKPQFLDKSSIYVPGSVVNKDVLLIYAYSFAMSLHLS